MGDLIIGIDLGTSGVKVGILDLDSQALEHVCQREYDNSPEQDTDQLFESTLDTLKELVSAVESKKQISAIGLSGQMHGAVLYDQAGEIIHPLINWQERNYSSDLVIEQIKDRFGPDGAVDTGIEIASGLTGAILFGIKQDYPDLFARIDKFLLPTDFIRSKLLGGLDHKTDQTNAFSTGLFNTLKSSWHNQLIRILGLPSGIFPQVHNTSNIAGALCEEITELLGLDKPIPIVVGGGDNQMSMLGSGLISQSSPALINIGTSAQISMVAADYLRVPGVDTRSFFNGLFAFVGASLSGGGSFQWLRDQIRNEKGVEITFAEMDQLAAQASPGADGLLFSSGPSRNRPERLMGFYGNREPQSSINNRARAVMEGVIFDLYELYQGLEPYNDAAVIIGAGKGLQKSKIWPQIAADIFQKPIQITNFENALFGAALMAAVGIGALQEIDIAVSSIKVDRQIYPFLDHAVQYQNEVIDHWKSILDRI